MPHSPRPIPRSRVPRLAETERRLRAFPLYVMPFEQHDLGLHRHDFTELVYVRHGFGSHVHAGQEYPIHRGDCFVIPPRELHGYRNAEDLRIVNVIFRAPILDGHREELWKVDGFRQFFALEPSVRAQTRFKYKLHLSAQQDEVLGALVDEMTEEQRARRPGWRIVNTGLLAGLVVTLSRFFRENTDVRAVEHAAGGPNSGVARAIAHVEWRFREELTLAGVAEVACMSPGHLSHEFRRATGMALFDYLLQFRIGKARFMLQTTARPVREIAASVGFRDPAYFSRAFRKSAGMSPQRFRQGVRQE